MYFSKGVWYSFHPSGLSRISRRIALVTPFIFFSFLYFFIVIGPDHWQLAPQTHFGLEGIPKKIWYKLGPRGLTAEARTWIDSCIDQNPEYEYEFMTDELSEAWVAENFVHYPELVEMYHNLTMPILKADILRYLLLFTEGGVYADLDITCNVPIDKWVPPSYQANSSLVVGWEFDVGWGENIVREFATWTIMAKPHSPHLWALTEAIMQNIREKTKAHNLESVGQLTPEMVGDVVDTTSPRMFTKSIIQSLEQVLQTPINENNIKNLRHPRLVGDVLILPGYSFAAGSNHYDPEEQLGPPLVTHHAAGSWKNEHWGELA